MLKACNFPLPLFLPKAKASGKKLQKVTLKVSPRGIVLNDSGTNELIENISIYRCVMGHTAAYVCLEPSSPDSAQGDETIVLCWHLSPPSWVASSDVHPGLN